MNAIYAVTADVDRDLLRMKLSGFFDAAELTAFDEVRRAAHTQLRCGPNQHATLVDVRDLKIQAQSVFEAFRALLADPATRARRVAFVTGDAAIRLQVRRIAQRDDVRFFVDTAAAEQWLTALPARRALAG